MTGSIPVAAQRQAFLRLLRAGIRDKQRRQLHQHHQRPVVAIAPLAAPTRAWEALAWRDAHVQAPFFEETICGQPLRIRQLQQGELSGLGTGLTVWPAACLLLKHLEHRYVGDPTISEALVVELGSGTGAVGIAAAMLGARRVVLTDLTPLLFLLESNAELARQQGHVHIDVEPFEWGGDPPNQRILDADAAPPTLVLVSDCILPKLYPIEPLIAALDTLAPTSATTILISYEHRLYEHFDPKTKFWELLRARGFALRELRADEYHPLYRADDLEIWEARREPS